MNLSRDLPKWLVLAAVILLVEAVTILIVVDVRPLVAVVTLGITCLLAFLLLKASRFAWILLLIGAATLVIGPALWDQPIWSAATGAVITICLLTPASKRYVWADRRPAGISAIAPNGIAQRVYVRWVQLRSSGLRLGEGGRARLHRLLFILGFGILLSIPIINRVRDYHEGDGSGDAVVDVFWAVIGALYMFARLAFVILALIAIFDAVVSRTQNPQKNSD